MNARPDSSDEPAAGSSSGRAMIIGAGLFAVAATVLLVLADELRWLRLGIVAALWAALVGAFVAARYRRQVLDQKDAAADRQKIYELELEREIAARREYELEVAAEAKRRAEEDARDDLAELRGELQRMRQTLESLLGGEFLVERYALRAESTRMRSLPEDRSIAARNDLKRLPPALQAEAEIVPPIVREAETELIERIREVHHKPRRPEPKSQEIRPVRRPATRVDRPAPEPVTPKPRPEHPAELSDRWFIPDGIANTAAPRRVEPTPTPAPAPAPPSRSENPPRRAVDAPPQRPTEPAPRRPAAPRNEGDPEWDRSGYHAPAAAYNPNVPGPGKAEQTGWTKVDKPQKPNKDAASYGSRGYVQPAAPAAPKAPKPPEPALTDRPSRRNAEFHDEPPPASRHRDAPAEEAPDEGGGRRRRAEGQPSWQESINHEDPPSGSHTAGRSVNELLANHGLDSSPRRRRRREE